MYLQVDYKYLQPTVPQQPTTKIFKHHCDTPYLTLPGVSFYQDQGIKVTMRIILKQTQEGWRLNQSTALARLLQDVRKADSASELLNNTIEIGEETRPFLHSLIATYETLKLKCSILLQSSVNSISCNNSILHPLYEVYLHISKDTHIRSYTLPTHTKQFPNFLLSVISLGFHFSIDCLLLSFLLF